MRRGRYGAMAAALLSLFLAAGGAGAEQLGSIRVVNPQVRAIDGILVDVNAAALRDSSSIRLAVVPAGTPDAITDINVFAANSMVIHASRVRLTLPGGPPGKDEVRLYHLPPTGTAFVVAARAPVTVLPGVAGAVLARDLGHEAAAMGPLRFEARYRDTPVLMQAQFLRVRPETEWSPNWLNAANVVGRRLAVMSLGTRGVVPDRFGSTNEIICIMADDGGPILSRIARLNPGDAVLVKGYPTSWGAASAADPVLLRACQFAN